MANGASGVHGQDAQQPVDLEFKLGTGFAIAHHQEMEDYFVR